MSFVCYQCAMCGALNSMSNKKCGKCKVEKKIAKQF